MDKDTTLLTRYGYGAPHRALERDSFLIVDCATGTVISAASARIVPVSKLPDDEFERFSDDDYIAWAERYGALVPVI